MWRSIPLVWNNNNRFTTVPSAMVLHKVCGAQRPSEKIGLSGGGTRLDGSLEEGEHKGLSPIRPRPVRWE